MVQLNPQDCQTVFLFVSFLKKGKEGSRQHRDLFCQLWQQGRYSVLNVPSICLGASI